MGPIQTAVLTAGWPGCREVPVSLDLGAGCGPASAASASLLTHGLLRQSGLHPPLPCQLGLMSPEPFCLPELTPEFRAWVSDCLLDACRDTVGCPRTHLNQNAPSLSPCPSPPTGRPRSYPASPAPPGAPSPSLVPLPLTPLCGAVS